MTLIRYRLRRTDGTLLPGSCIDAARPGETREDLLSRLVVEFGGRILIDAEDQ